MLSDARRTLRVATLAIAAAWLPLIVRSGPLPHDLTYDDAFYYFEIGRNIANGVGSTFDGINTTNGYHPLWMLVVAAAYFVGFDGVGAIRALLVVQLAMWIGALWLLAGVVADSIDRWANLAGRADESKAARRGSLLVGALWFVIGANPYIFKLFVNGMETGVAALVGAALLVLAVRNGGDGMLRPVLAAILAGFAFLARTDAVFVLGSMLLWSVAIRRRVDRSVLLAGGVLAATVAGYVVSNLVLVGHPLQISGVTKRVDLDLARAGTAIVCVVAAVAVFGAGLRARAATKAAKLARTRAWFAATAWWPAGALLLVGYEWGFTTEVYLWHYAPQVLWAVATIPFLVSDIFEGAILERPDDDPAGARRSLLVAGILAAPFVIGGAWQSVRFVDPELRSMQLGDRATGEWITANLPDDAVVASFDAGVIGYFADQPVVNLDGLVNSYDWYDARRAGIDDTTAFLADSGVTHIANHGDPVDGDEPSFRAAIDGLISGRAGTHMELVHRIDYVYSGTAGGRSGLRPYATFVWQLRGP